MSTNPITPTRTSAFKRYTKTDWERFVASPTVVDMAYGAPKLHPGATGIGRNCATFARNAAEAAKAVGDTHWRLANDVTFTEAARLDKSASFARARLKIERARFAEVAAPAADFIASRRKSLDQHLQPAMSAGQAQIDSELRALVRGTSDQIERLKLVEDPAIRAAIARAPRQLSGLAEEAYARAQREHLQEVAADELEELEDAEAGLQCAQKAIDRFENDLAALIDFQAADAVAGRKYEPVNA